MIVAEREGRRSGLWGVASAVGALIVVVVLAAGSPAAASGGRVPARFFGMVGAGPLLDGRVTLNLQLASMRRLGTGSIRFPIYWSDAQPYASWSDVPADQRAQFTSAGGRPTTFAEIDEQILDFASHGLQMLPVIVQAPGWARLQPTHTWSPPARPADFGRFVGDVVERYGAGGEFWVEHPQLAHLAPRWWQIWNEPAGGDRPEGHTFFWDGPKPYEPRYLAMLRAARQAARAADPHARIVLAGLFGRSWTALARIYAYRGGGLFDAVAIHPYANTPEHVLTILRDVHRVLLNHRANRLPLLVTETGWTSSAGHAPKGVFGIETTPARQASNLAHEYPLLVAHRRELNLQGLYWYTWIGTEPGTNPFDYAGLLRFTPTGQIQAKPAFWAYRRVLRRLEG